MRLKRVKKYLICNYPFFGRIKITVKRTENTGKKMRLAGISEFFIDEYEITGKIDVPQSQLSKGVQRVGDIISAVVRGTDRGNNV